MKLEVGKYYRTRDGQKVGPMYECDNHLEEFGVLYGQADEWLTFAFFANSGKRRYDGGPADVVAEWDEEAPDGHQESDYHEWNSALEAVVKQLYHLGNIKLLDGNSAFMVLSIIHEMKR